MKQLSRESRSFIVTPERLVQFTKATVCLTCICFPLPNAKKVYVILYNVFLCFSIFISMALVFPLIISIKTFSNDIFVVIKSSILTSAILNYLVKVIAVIMYREKIQGINLNMENFLKSASAMERNDFQINIDKFWKFHILMTCSYYLTTVGVIIGPLILPQKFPCDAVYPFPVDHPIVACLVYIHQCVVGFQCSAGMALDCQIALFLWYLGARYIILITKSTDVKNIKELHIFIKEHQDLLFYANEITYPIKVITLATVISTRIGMIFGAIMLVSDQPSTVKIQFVIIIISTTVNIFVCVWAADNLMHVFISTSFSFFTALRVLVNS